jgi:hypothetical protein
MTEPDADVTVRLCSSTADVNWMSGFALLGADANGRERPRYVESIDRGAIFWERVRQQSVQRRIVRHFGNWD